MTSLNQHENILHYDHDNFLQWSWYSRTLFNISISNILWDILSLLSVTWLVLDSTRIYGVWENHFVISRAKVDILFYPVLSFRSQQLMIVFIRAHCCANTFETLLKINFPWVFFTKDRQPTVTFFHYIITIRNMQSSNPAPSNIPS